MLVYPVFCVMIGCSSGKALRIYMLAWSRRLLDIILLLFLVWVMICSFVDHCHVEVSHTPVVWRNGCLGLHPLDSLLRCLSPAP